MTMRLHELHPTLVHYPIALLPLAVGADLLARVLNRPSLSDVGRALTSLATVGMGVSAAAGLVAQDAVKAEGRAHDLLVTHRNLNVGLFAGTVALALRRRRREPSLGSLAVGLSGLALMSYTAYLGGKMVYAHGVGVEAAGGFDEAKSPPLTTGHLGQAVSVAKSNAIQALKHAGKHLREGEVVPALADGHGAETRSD